jgi:hypothetical protein
MGWFLGQLTENWKDFWGFEFLGELQRRGAHVSIPEKGSRDGKISFGGILCFYAEL